MYGNTFYDPTYNIDRLNKRKEEIDSLIRSYQNMNTQTPVNNFINTNLLGYGNQNSNYPIGQFVILSCNNVNKRGTIATDSE